MRGHYIPEYHVGQKYLYYHQQIPNLSYIRPNAALSYQTSQIVHASNLLNNNDYHFYLYKPYDYFFGKEFHFSANYIVTPIVKTQK